MTNERKSQIFEKLKEKGISLPFAGDWNYTRTRIATIANDINITYHEMTQFLEAIGRDLKLLD